MIIVLVEVESDRQLIAAQCEDLRRMEIASEAEEGCVSYRFTTEVNNPDKIRLTEIWQSMAALEAHMQTPHMAEFNKLIRASAPKSIISKIYPLGDELAHP